MWAVHPCGHQTQAAEHYILIGQEANAIAKAILLISCVDPSARSSKVVSLWPVNTACSRLQCSCVTSGCNLPFCFSQCDSTSLLRPDSIQRPGSVGPGQCGGSPYAAIKVFSCGQAGSALRTRAAYSMGLLFHWIGFLGKEMVRHSSSPFNGRAFRRQHLFPTLWLMKLTAWLTNSSTLPLSEQV